MVRYTAEIQGEGNVCESSTFVHKDRLDSVPSDMDHNCKEFVQPVGVDSIIDGVEQAQLKGKRDAVGEFDVLLQVLLVLEPLEVERKDVRAVLDLHALFGFLEAAARVAEEFVPLAEHLTRAELSEARGDGRVLLNVD